MENTIKYLRNHSQYKTIIKLELVLSFNVLVFVYILST